MLNRRQLAPGPLDRVRTACKSVAKEAVHVRIDVDRIASYAASLPLERIRRPEHHPQRHYLGQGDDTAAFFLTLDAVNFGSGYSPHLRKRPGMSGYFSIASSLADHYRAHGPLSAQALSLVCAQDCARIFGQDLNDDAVGEMMALFAAAWNELGRYLLDRFGGSHVALVQAADSSAERLVQTLIEMPFYDDVALYDMPPQPPASSSPGTENEGTTGSKEMRVPFYKRAQLTAADLAIAFAGRGTGHFADLDRLTIFADNLVPHVLRVDGVLRYDPYLLARIDRGALIPAGSPEEVEVRACALHTVELLVAELRGAGQDVNAMKLDYLLWNRGQQPQYKAQLRHRTRTVYY